MTQAFPLQWPDTMPRAKSRSASAFKTTLPKAIDNVETSLRAFGRDSGKVVADVVLSSNVTLGVNNPADPGVAAWFTWDGEQRCIAVDRYTKVQDNLQAIFHVMEARRTELRHGTLALVRATFQGFKALPPPAGAKDWPEVLGLPRTATREQVDQAFRQLSAKAHPDVEGGSREAFDDLTRAKRLALRDMTQG